MCGGRGLDHNGRMAGLDHIRTDGRHAPPTALLDRPMGLSRLEASALTSVRRWGTPGLILRVSLGAVVASMLLTAALMVLVVGPAAGSFLPGLLVGTLVPAVVAPPIITVIARLVARLDETGQLLVEAAITDPLTGIYNRRGFFDGFDATTVDPGPLAVAMIDVDDFKQLNDRFGHAAGDAILRHMAQWLEAHAEDRGAVARLGGDEFVMVAPAKLIGRLQTYEHLMAATIDYSATIGTAPIEEDGLRSALAEADAELYRHKAARRRRRD